MSPALIYGTKTDHWKHSAEAGYDLTRGTTTGKPILTQKGPVKVEPSLSALVVVDMQCVVLLSRIS